MKQWVLFDLDHTLVDATRRDHLIPEARRTDDWHVYHTDSVNDGPADDVVKLLRLFQDNGHSCGGITARPQRYREITETWLMDHGIKLDVLLMHKRDAWEPSAELKICLAEEYFGSKIAEKVLFIIDDHPEVVAAFAKIGVTSLQVHGRSYDKIVETD
jgi:hypothetical protein